MKRSHWVIALAVLAGATLAAVLLARSRAAGSSALSPSPSGWLAARRYLSARGRETVISDRSLDAAAPGAIVTVFPWEDPLEASEAQIRSRVSRGADLLIGYSGRRIGQAEEDLLGAFGISVRDVRGDLPLEPLAWYRYRTEVWRLRPAAPPSSAEGSGGPRQPVICLAPRRIPVAPAAAQTLYTGPDGVAAIFLLRVGRGRVLVLPADALSNARLASAGNADLLESAGRMLSGRIVFDEFHHGLRPPGPAPQGASLPFDLWLAQLLLVYALAVLALSRRLGRPWREEPVRAGTTASFLLGLATRHRALGHGAAAARLLLSRVARLDPSIPVTAEMARAAETADEQTLVALAAGVSRGAKK